jgi:peptide methionine sulfoxide reductase msrA/msrB
MHRYHPLSFEEELIISKKHTEPPFSSEFEKFDGVGIYICKRCDAPLFASKDKFVSACGWPSFDEPALDSIKETLDADGTRTEILCARCSAHLGHLFLGELFTRKNKRYCVNSLSLRFIPAFTDQGYEKAYFAGGCFWGVEHLLSSLKVVIETKVGYMGGTVVDPTYEEVCSNLTHHAEVTQVVFDRDRLSYLDLTKYFLEIHDPTQLNQQGPDIGDQYRSEIFYLTDYQKEQALNLLETLRKKGYNIQTKVSMASMFYQAEDYHQNYYKKSFKQPYCHIYTKRF